MPQAGQPGGASQAGQLSSLCQGESQGIEYGISIGTCFFMTHSSVREHDHVGQCDAGAQGVIRLPMELQLLGWWVVDGGGDSVAPSLCAEMEVRYHAAPGKAASVCEGPLLKCN